MVSGSAAVTDSSSLLKMVANPSTESKNGQKSFLIRTLGSPLSLETLTEMFKEREELTAKSM